MKGNRQYVWFVWNIGYKILIIINIGLGQILLSHIANTHVRIHRRRRSGCHCSMGRWRPTVMQLKPLFVASRSFIQINTRAGDTVSVSCWLFFACRKIARPYCQSIIYEQFETSPRRSRKHCDLQFANSVRFKENILYIVWTGGICLVCELVIHVSIFSDQYKIDL